MLNNILIVIGAIGLLLVGYRAVMKSPMMIEKHMNKVRAQNRQLLESDQDLRAELERISALLDDFKENYLPTLPYEEEYDLRRDHKKQKARLDNVESYISVFEKSDVYLELADIEKVLLKLSGGGGERDV